MTMSLWLSCSFYKARIRTYKKVIKKVEYGIINSIVKYKVCKTGLTVHHKQNHIAVSPPRGRGSAHLVRQMLLLLEKSPLGIWLLLLCGGRGWLQRCGTGQRFGSLIPALVEVTPIVWRQDFRQAAVPSSAPH